MASPAVTRAGCGRSGTPRMTHGAAGAQRLVRFPEGQAGRPRPRPSVSGRASTELDRTLPPQPVDHCRRVGQGLLPVDQGVHDLPEPGLRLAELDRHRLLLRAAVSPPTGGEVQDLLLLGGQRGHGWSVLGGSDTRAARPRSSPGPVRRPTGQMPPAAVGAPVDPTLILPPGRLASSLRSGEGEQCRDPVPVPDLRARRHGHRDTPSR